MTKTLIKLTAHWGIEALKYAGVFYLALMVVGFLGGWIA